LGSYHSSATASSQELTIRKSSFRLEQPKFEAPKDSKIDGALDEATIKFFDECDRHIEMWKAMPEMLKKLSKDHCHLRSKRNLLTVSILFFQQQSYACGLRKKLREQSFGKRLPPANHLSPSLATTGADAACTIRDKRFNLLSATSTN
jgi:hypothetical protein